MKRAKKLAALFLSLAMVLALAACGGKDNTNDNASGSNGGDGSTADAKLKICIITTTGIDDGSFNQNCYEGIQAFIADHPDCTVSDIKEPDYNELVPTVERMAGDYDVFVLPGFNFSACGDVAAANPDTYFLVVDSTITDAEGNDKTLEIEI